MRSLETRHEAIRLYRTNPSLGYSDVARQLDIPKETVRRWLVAYGIGRRRKTRGPRPALPSEKLLPILCDTVLMVNAHPVPALHLCARAGVSHNYVNDIRRGASPSLNTLVPFLEACGYRLRLEPIKE